MKGNINMSKYDNEIKAAEAHLAELKAKQAQETETHGFNFRDIAEIFGGKKATEDKAQDEYAERQGGRKVEADLEEYLGINKDHEATHEDVYVVEVSPEAYAELSRLLEDGEATDDEIREQLNELEKLFAETRGEGEAETPDFGKIFNDTVASVKTKGEELFTKVKDSDTVAKVRENELFNKAQTKATDWFTKAKTKATDVVEAGKDKFYELKDEYSYYKELKAKYPDAEFVKLSEDTFSVRLPQFGNDFVFTFVDEHSLVGVDYIAEEEHEPAPVHEDGFITSIVSGHAHVHHKIEFVNEIEVEGLDDIDTLAEVLNDYFTL